MPPGLIYTMTSTSTILIRGAEPKWPRRVVARGFLPFREDCGERQLLNRYRQPQLQGATRQILSWPCSCPGARFLLLHLAD